MRMDGACVRVRCDESLGPLVAGMPLLLLPAGSALAQAASTTSVICIISSRIISSKPMSSEALVRTEPARAEKRFLTALSVRPPIDAAIFVQLLPHLR
jgi:hypothetical protein